MTKGLVLNLKMRDKQGSVVTDYSRYGNDGAVNGGVVWTERGMRFDGSSGYLDCGNDSSLRRSSLSVFGWLKPLIIQSVRKAVVSSGDTANYATNNYILESYEDEIRVLGRTPEAVLASSSVLTVDEWTFVGFINNGSNTKIYADGVEVGSGSQTLGVDDATGHFIGSAYNTTTLGSFFKGSIDDPRIYNYALPLREIKAHYNATRHNYD